MTGVCDRETGVGGQESGDRSRETGPRFRLWLSPVSCLLISVILVLPLFAHGCHTGDHDDEPQFAPPAHHRELPP